MTNEIIEEVKTWQCRPLDKLYPRPIFKAMNPILRQTFLLHPEASKVLLKLVKEHNFPLINLIPEEERLICYLQEPADLLFYPKLA